MNSCKVGIPVEKFYEFHFTCEMKITRRRPALLSEIISKIFLQYYADSEISYNLLHIFTSGEFLSNPLRSAFGERLSVSKVVMQTLLMISNVYM